MIIIEIILIAVAITAALAYLIYSFTRPKKNIAACSNCSGHGSCKTKRDHC